LILKSIKLKTNEINLDQFLKWTGMASTGGQAKLMIAEGNVKVNGIPELKRSRKLHSGDTIEIHGLGSFKIE
jgi:ribosome-associated protein